MSRSIPRRLYVLLSVLVGLPLACCGLVYGASEYQLRRVYDVPAPNFAIPDDDASRQRGEHLVQTVGGCADCHGGTNLVGAIVFDDPLIGTLAAPNLTPGNPRIAAYSDSDWVAAIRHGVGADGRALVGVSAGSLRHLSNADTAAIIAFLKSSRPFPRTLPARRMGPMGRLFVALAPLLPEPGRLGILPAAFIDHEVRPAAAPESAVSAAYGQYLVRLTCVECHHEDLAGGTDPGEGLNITPGGRVGKWSEADFVRALRSGRRPDGTFLDADMMPSGRLRRFTEDELSAIWLYLQSVPAVTEPTMEPTPDPSASRP